MKVVNFFMKLLSCLFILLFGLVCLFTTVFFMTKNMVSYNSISSFINSANIFDYKSEDAESDSATIRQQIDKEMLNMNVPAVVTDSVLDSDEIHDMISKYIYDYSHYIFMDENKPVFPTSKILSLVENKYEESEGKSLSQSQKKDITKYINSLGEKIDKTLFDTGELEEVVSLDIVKLGAVTLNSMYILYALSAVIVVLFIIICLCLGSIKRAINWSGKAILVDGFILVIFSFVEVKILIAYFNSQGLLDNLAIFAVEKGFQNLLVYGGILIGVGIILIIISAVLFRKERKKKSDNILEKVIEEEVDKVKIDDEPENVVNDKKEESIVDVEKEKTVADYKREKNVQSEDKTTKETGDKENEQDEKVNQEQREEPKEEVEKSLDNLPVKEDKMEMVPVPEKSKNQGPSKPKKQNPDKKKKQEVAYKELNDKKSDEKPIEVEKKEIQVKPLENVQIDLIHPVKGNDIEVNNTEENNDDIEVL